MDRELLIEIGVEELPAAWLAGLTRQLGERLEGQLKKNRLAYDAKPESYATPRRLTVHVAKIAERQDDLEEVVTGPPVSAAFDKDGQATPGAVGFAKKYGVSVADLVRAASPRGEYLTYLKRQRGRSAIDTLPAVLSGVLRDLPFPKQMKWDATLDDGRGEFVFGRPIRWLLFLYGGRVVPFTIGRAPNAAGAQVQDVESGALTYGHRFLATSGRPGRSIKVRSFDEYLTRLKEHFVVLDHAERQDRIARDLERHARRLNGRVVLKDRHGLVDEVADLVEYPEVVAGFFDPAFLALPEEVLTTTLVHHQHYFPVVSDRGELKEAFLAVVNIQPKDERLIARNAERVVTARLRDARFFWETDRKATLESRLDRLRTLQFHKKLGSYREKAERISALARWIAAEAFGRPEAADQAGTAGRLAKADLTTDMVFEFPELQGTMGGIYAREEGLPEQVWKAIYYHYLPIAVEADAPPTRDQLGDAAVTWAAVSLADKLDTLVGLASAGEKVTGSRDPFALRRNAQGVIRILVDLPGLSGIAREISLEPLVARARETLGLVPDARDEYPAFLYERLLSVLAQRGIPIEVVRAVAAPPDAVSIVDWTVSPLRANRIAEALQRMRASEDFQALAVLFKRVKNIARELAELAPLEREALTEPAERALLAELDARQPVISAAAAAAEYARAFTEMAGFRAVVDRFFTEVFVMAEDARVRTARLTLMASLRDLILDLADISEIVPHTE
jgi:glycyl-tRNA synthetase beta chain